MFVILVASHCSLRGHSPSRFRNNIGNVDGEKYIAYGPIDVVYTWVNGSDPVWKAKKEFWAQKLAQSHYHEEEHSTNSSSTTSTHTEATIVNGTFAYGGNHTLSAGDNSTEAILNDEDAETMTANRYRDSEELRYSLRSLVKNAPWIRHIYLVTDNQIPYWLNLESSKLTVLSHEDIFSNKSHLPVFSSPAIEANLHNIPGISKKFIYFNDDVFLGAPTLPDDFVSLTGAQKFVMAWDVPKCAPGCSDSWIGDGYCDRACNVSECNWDFPDCVNGSNANPSGFSGYDSSTQTVNVYCTKYCPDTWLADKICDQRCKIPECGWDFGDCGLDLVLDGFHGVTLDSALATIPADEVPVPHGMPHATPGEESEGSVQYFPSGHHYGANDDSIRDRNPYYYGSSMIAGPTPALVVPYGTFAVYFNLSMLPCHALSINSTHRGPCSLQNLSQSFLYTSSSHDDLSKFVVHQSIVLNKHNLLVVSLYHGQEDAPKPHFYPYTVTFTVEGAFPDSDSVQMTFALQIIDPNDVPKLDAYLPKGIAMVESVVGDRVHSFGLESKKRTNHNASAHENATIVSAAVTKPDTAELLLLPIRLASQEERLIYLVHSLHVHHFLRNAAVLTAGGRHQLNASRAEVVLAHMIVRTTFTLANGTQFTHEESFLDALVEYTLDRVNFQRKSLASLDSVCGEADGSRCSDRLWNQLCNDYRSFLESNLARLLFDSPAQRRVVRARLASLESLPRISSLDEQAMAEDSEKIEGGGLLVSVPLPVQWLDLPLDWQHVKVELGVSATSSERKTASQWIVHQLSNASDAAPLAAWPQHVAWTSLIRYGRNMSLPLPVESETTAVADVTQQTAQHDALSSQANATSVTAAADETPIAPVAVEGIAAYVSEAASVNQTSSGEEALSTSPANDVPSSVVHSEAPLEAQQTQDATAATEATANRRHRRRLVAKKSSSTLQSLWSKVLRPVWDMYTTPLVNLFDYVSTSPMAATSMEAPEEFISRQRHRRRLLDTYAQSLIHVNRLYNKAFGTENRKVPAHVPHMIDRDYMSEMQEKWSAEWNATSSHRFRAVNDMQFAFAYYYYVMNRRKIQPPDFLPYLEHAIDTNGDKFVEPNEWHTLLSVVAGSRFTDDDDLRFSHCVRFPHFYHNQSHAFASNDTTASYAHANVSFLHPTRNPSSPAMRHSTIEEHHHRHGKVVKSVAYFAYPRLSELLECPLIVDALKTKIDWQVRQPSHVTESDKDLVAFEMIGDNMTDSLNQLNSIRQRQSKFICVNDNMQNPSPELTQSLRAFFESMYPTPSDFELPPHQRNPTLYIDEYRYLQVLRRQQRQSLSYRLSQLAAMPWLHEGIETLRQRVRTVVLSWAQYVLDTTPEDKALEAVSPEVAELQRLQHRLRQDARRDPFAHDQVASRVASQRATKTVSMPSKGKSPSSSSDHMWQAHVAAWMMVAGLVAIVAVRLATNRMSMKSSTAARSPHDHKKDDDASVDDAASSASSSHSPPHGRPSRSHDSQDDMDDDEANMLHRLQRIERRMYQQEDDEDYDVGDLKMLQLIREKEAFSRLPLSTPQQLDGGQTHVPFQTSATHDQVVGYRPVMEPTSVARMNSHLAAPSYPKRFQTMTRPSQAPKTDASTAGDNAAGKVEEEEEVVVVDDRVYTADDSHYLRKYSAAMLEDAAGTGPGTTAMQWEIFSDGALRSAHNRSRANSESFTATTFPGHK